MDELDVKIDFMNKLLRIGNEEIVFSGEETPMGRRERIKRILDQDTAIPANSEIIVKAHLEKETDRGLVTVEPLEHEMEDLLTARCLVDSSDASHTIPVRVSNLKDNRITLKQGKLIGTCEPIVRVARCSEDAQKTVSRHPTTEELSIFKKT